MTSFLLLHENGIPAGNEALSPNSRSVDFSDASARALKQAKSVAERFKATIELLHVVANPYTVDTSPFYTPLPAGFLKELEKTARKWLDRSLTRAERDTLTAGSGKQEQRHQQENANRRVRPAKRAKRAQEADAGQGVEASL